MSTLEKSATTLPDITKSPWRSDFPLLARKVRGKNLIYLDSAATALKPWPVIERVGHFLTYETANVHRGAHYLADQATTQYENARSTMAAFIGAQPEEIVFTRGTTESINLVAHGLLDRLKPGDEILLTELEHHSNLVPWHLIAKKSGARIKAVPLQKSGSLSLQDFDRLITSQTKVVSVTHCSNVLGSVVDLAAVVKLAHARGALVVGDGAQMVANHDIKVKELGVDFYAFSGHKMYGPYGIGVLYGRRDLLQELPPYQGGGSMIANVSIEDSTYLDAPTRFEAGTPNIEGALGMAAAAQYIQSQSRGAMLAHEAALKQELLNRLQFIEGIQIYSCTLPTSGPIVSFNLGRLHPGDIAQILDQENIAIRAGHHCAQPLMKVLGINACARISLSIYNQQSDIDAVVAGLKKAKEILS